ncbi:hypothetical protein [Actinomyces sp. ZJ308]|uniref:hypothetical protein n=1 Tax=Actinomyces sp. ZJ308 TaxID=2708342 RepID=UPI0014214B7D|nr:hypothetical protein [Actinomyces sp. ZJ308]
MSAATSSSPSSPSSLTSFISSLEQPPPAWGRSDEPPAPMSMGLGRVIGRLLKQIIWRR